ncbi:MAG: hypothetical protein QMC79_06590 [Anaerosomatales bacterium]|nr:hypothetical protein [Anaerosomatales bacterium]
MDALAQVGRLSPYGRMGRPLAERAVEGFPFGGIVVAVGFLVVLAVVIALVVWAVTRRSRTTSGAVPIDTGTRTTPAMDEALRIARERLARGEIDAEQYTTIAEALRS